MEEYLDILDSQPAENQYLSEDGREYFSAGRTTGGKGEGVVKLFRDQFASSININYKKQGVDVTTKMNDTFSLMASGSTTPIGDTCFYPSSGGDSGSAVLTYDENINEWLIVGLLYGGSHIIVDEVEKPIRSLCNRIDRIESLMNIRAWDGTMNGITPYGGGNSIHVVEGSSQTIDMVIGCKTYWQLGLVNSTSYPPSI